MNRHFSVSKGLPLALALVCSFTAPAEARFPKIRQRFEQVRQRVKSSGTTFRVNYTPPRMPFSVSCDSQRNMYTTISPRVSTPLGSFGVSGTRRVRSLRCG
jgi:hypothetical protein